MRRYEQRRPDRGTGHFTTTLGDRLLRWERHTEYNRYSFVSTGAPADLQGSCIPEDWLDGMHGEVLVAVKAQVIGAVDGNRSVDEISAEYFSGNTLIGSGIADNNAIALTDSRIHSDGFRRVLSIDEGMPVPSRYLRAHLSGGKTFRKLSRSFFRDIHDNNCECPKNRCARRAWPG